MSRTISLDELHAEARDRYGSNPQAWAYECPECGDVANGPDVAHALSQQPIACAQGHGLTAGQVLARVCLPCGATADEHGTTTVTLPDNRPVHVFELAPKKESKT